MAAGQLIFQLRMKLQPNKNRPNNREHEVKSRTRQILPNERLESIWKSSQNKYILVITDNL